MDFRAAHHWLHGYSDALHHRPENLEDALYSKDYFKGYTSGLKFRASAKANI